MIRYANDIPLTELARSLTRQMADLNALLQDGRLDSAFIIAENMGFKIASLQYRLNDIKFGRAE
jgi:hypothetical protein